MCECVRCGGGKENTEVDYFLSWYNTTSRSLTLDSDILELAVSF